jgi:hypothetical protein
VGKATRDESPFGCRDVAGNGLEWTYDLSGSGQVFPVPEDKQHQSVETRGRAYTADTGPLRFRDRATYEREGNLTGAGYTEALPTVSFRVVLDLTVP